MTRPETREEPAEYGGGVWVCDECGSTDISKDKNICEECEQKKKTKRRNLKHDFIERESLIEFVAIFGDAVNRAEAGDERALRGFVTISTAIQFALSKNESSDAHKPIALDYILDGFDLISEGIE